MVARLSLVAFWMSALAGCSDDAGGERDARNGDVERAVPHEMCPTGAPVDADVLFASRAGTYSFTLLNDECGMDVRVTSGTAYAVTIQAAPKSLVVQTDAGEQAYAWDGRFDLACEGDSANLVEIGWDAGFARAAFIGDDPFAFLLGLCSGDLGP